MFSTYVPTLKGKALDLSKPMNLTWLVHFTVLDACPMWTGTNINPLSWARRILKTLFKAVITKMPFILASFHGQILAGDQSWISFCQWFLRLWLLYPPVNEQFAPENWPLRRLIIYLPFGFRPTCRGELLLISGITDNLRTISWLAMPHRQGPCSTSSQPRRSARP